MRPPGLQAARRSTSENSRSCYSHGKILSGSLVLERCQGEGRGLWRALTSPASPEHANLPPPAFCFADSARQGSLTESWMVGARSVRTAFDSWRLIRRSFFHSDGAGFRTRSRGMIGFSTLSSCAEKGEYEGKTFCHKPWISARPPKRCLGIGCGTRIKNRERRMSCFLLLSKQRLRFPLSFLPNEPDEPAGPRFAAHQRRRYHFMPRIRAQAPLERARPTRFAAVCRIFPRSGPTPIP